MKPQAQGTAISQTAEAATHDLIAEWILKFGAFVFSAIFVYYAQIVVRYAMETAFLPLLNAPASRKVLYVGLNLVGDALILLPAVPLVFAAYFMFQKSKSV